MKHVRLPSTAHMVRLMSSSSSTVAIAKPWPLGSSEVLFAEHVLRKLSGLATSSS